MHDTTPAASLESPTMISAAGGDPTMGIIEELTLRACRLRSLADFALGTPVSFDVTLRGAPKVPLTGRVTSIAENGIRRSYTIAFDDLDGRQGDRVAMALDMAQRFASSHHFESHTGTALTRSSPRIPLEIDVTYVWERSGARSARTTNLSSGGVLMNAPDTDVPVGASLELRFTLPGSPDETRLHARVVAHQMQSPNYNIAFYEVSDDVRERLERFVAARLPKPPG